MKENSLLNKIKEESIEYKEDERKFIIKQDKPIKLKKCFIDEIGTPNFFGNIIEPNYDCQIIKDNIVVRIELPGDVLVFTPKMTPIRGFYLFNYKGTIKFPKEDSTFKEGNMKDGEFRLEFRIPMKIGIIKDSKPKIEFDDPNGIAVVTYKISKFDDDDDNGDIDVL